MANNLNDISKDHPDVVVDVVRRWWDTGGPERRRLVRHALRTLIKAAHPGALGVLGYGPDSPARLRSLACSPVAVAIGGTVRLEAVVENPSASDAGALVDFRVHFVKANGSLRPKVFKGAERTVAPEREVTVRTSVSLAQHSTRTHYPGMHHVEVLLNGTPVGRAEFEVV